MRVISSSSIVMLTSLPMKAKTSWIFCAAFFLSLRFEERKIPLPFGASK